MMRPEERLQQAIVRRLTADGYLVHFCGAATVLPADPNSRVRTLARRKRLGNSAGWPDLVVIGEYGNLCWLEVKAPKGRVSPGQKECHTALRDRGQLVYVVRSVLEAELLVRSACPMKAKEPPNTMPCPRRGKP